MADKSVDSKQTSRASDLVSHESSWGSQVPWWVKRRWLRLLSAIALRNVDLSYIKWARSKISPRKFRKIQEKLDREYPPSKFSPEKLIGREAELNLLQDSFRLHVIRHPMFVRYVDRDELPKAYCISGESGTGKTFLTLVALKQMLLEAYRNGLLVTPMIIRGTDVYSEFYGKTTRQLGRILDQATSAPSVIYIDEFQSFGRKVKGETGAEVEDTRLQDELNRFLDRILSGQTRTLVIVSTNSYEKIREDIRRRFHRLDLDSGIGRPMLLAVTESALQREGWQEVAAKDVLDLLEREASVRRKGTLTPSDILEVFKEVKKMKEAPFREGFRAGTPLPKIRHGSPRYRVTLEDFGTVSKSLKFYSDQEKSQEVMDAVYLLKPKSSREEIGGLHDVKHKILNNISLAFNPALSELGYESNSRFLLLGPPGTGKTLLAVVAAAENNVTFLRVRGGEMMSGATYIGEPEKRVKDLFSLARQKSPCILFLDEADAIFWGGDPNSNKILAQLKAELSELRAQERVVVIAASNKEHLIDPGTRDRFEPNIYYVHAPLNDSEWNEIVAIHLKKFLKYLHPEVEAPKITRMFRRQRVMSPRGVAETVSEAHRMWASEVTATWELHRALARNDKDLVEQVQRKYGDDLARVHAAIQLYREEGIELQEDHVNQENYKIRLLHFEKAISSLESLEEKQRREIAESLILPEPVPGVAYGLYTTERGTGGILTIQCTVRPIIPGERHLSVTGQASSLVMGQTLVPDDSVTQSAENAVEAVRSWLWTKTRMDLGKFHAHYQIRSLLEGAPGQGVSGPSAGYAMLNALISELAEISIPQSKVITGSIGLKMDVGPVGGLGGHGMQAGKLVGILKTERIKITDLLLPSANYKGAPDEMKMVESEGIAIHPVSTVQDGWKVLFEMGEEEILEKIVKSLKEKLT